MGSVGTPPSTPGAPGWGGVGDALLVPRACFPAGPAGKCTGKTMEPSTCPSFLPLLPRLQDGPLPQSDVAGAQRH